VLRGHGQEAKIGEAGGHRITRNCEALGSFLLTCATTELSLIAMWCLSGATLRGQPWTPAVTLSHGRDGLSVRRMAVLCTFRAPSLCRHVHRALLRNAVFNLSLIIPATACHQRNYVERYSRSKPLPMDSRALSTQLIHYHIKHPSFSTQVPPSGPDACAPGLLHSAVWRASTPPRLLSTLSHTLAQ
jgi:hypothetical protein